MKTNLLKITPLIVLTVLANPFRLAAADLTWDSDPVTTSGALDGAGNWTSLTTNTNWWDGAENVTWNNATPDNAIFGAGSGAAGVVTIPSSTTNTVGNLTFNAPGSGAYALAAGSSTTSKLNLSGTTITVASGVSATNLVVLMGTSFTKLGAGTLVLKPGAPNINTGPTYVGNGTLVIGSSTSRLLIPGDLTITNGATAMLGAAEQIADTGVLTVNGGTFDTGGKAETIAGVILDNSAQVLSSSSSTSLTNNGAIYDFRSGTVAPNLAGLAGLTKTTAGTVTLANGGGANTFAGPVLVSAGILELNHAGVGNGLPGVFVTITNSGMIRLLHDTEINSNATVMVAGGTYELLAHNESLGTLVLDNGGNILNGGNTAKTLTVNTNLDFRNGICASKLAGAGVLVKSTSGTVVLTMDNALTGGALINAGILQLGDGSSTNRGQFGTGAVTNNATLILNHSGAFTLANSISGIGSLTSLGGSPALTGTSTYTGNTTVSGGTLFVNNTAGSGTGSGNVIVQSGAALGGTGSIGGAVQIQSGGTLVPGNSGLGTLVINGALTLAAGSTSTFEVNGSTPANDAIVAGAGVVYGGTLNLTPSGTFTAGQQFVLFSGTGATNPGNFASLNGTPGTGLAFTFTNGILSVISTGTTAPVLGYAQTGSTLTFTWSDSTYKLQSQTNSLTTGLSTAWSDYPGGATSPVTVTFNPASPTVFFRLSQ